MVKMLSNRLIEFTIYRSNQLKTRKMVCAVLELFFFHNRRASKPYADQSATGFLIERNVNGDVFHVPGATISAKSLPLSN
jgi:hypothetical protein